MREILFRGKRTDTGEWVEGYYEFGYDSENEEPTHYMWVLNHTEKYGEMFIVIPETVGQYTGLTDKNGKKIFEGDIVKKDGYATPKIVKFGLHQIDCCGCCYESHQSVGFYLEYPPEKKPFLLEPNATKAEDDAWENLIIVGNIHDNPELLEVLKK